MELGATLKLCTLVFVCILGACGNCRPTWTDLPCCRDVSTPLQLKFENRKFHEVTFFYSRRSESASFRAFSPTLCGDRDASIVHILPEI
jgi:hypothetical protein